MNMETVIEYLAISGLALYSTTLIILNCLSEHWLRFGQKNTH
jgi:hypothetical protein